MENNKIDMFLMANARFFPPYQIMMIRKKLEEMNDEKFPILQSIRFKDSTATVHWGVFLGADRIYLDEVGVGILKIISMIFLIGIIWWIIDLFTFTERTRQYNMNEFTRAVMWL